jgi:hypothetical protein
MKPDLVILGFVLNDLSVYLHRPNAKGELRGLHPYAERTWFAENYFLGKIFYHSYFAHYIVKSINFAYLRLKRRFGMPTYEFQVRPDFHTAWKDFMWHSEERLFIKMLDLLKSNNIPLIVLCFPVKEQMEEKNIEKDKLFVLKPQQKLLEICQKLKIPLLDLWGSFYEGGNKKLFCDYLHLTQEGNIIAICRLVEFICELRLIRK